LNTDEFKAGSEGRRQLIRWEVCELLIAKGADANARSSDALTALAIAVALNKKEVAHFLRSKWAKE
jgi:ankyrin repeat protein